jgi:hypothetical protein
MGCGDARDDAFVEAGPATEAHVSRPLSVPAVVIALAVVAGACGSGGKPAATSGAGNGGALITQVASYDLAARRPLRILVGLQTGEQLVSFGRAQLSFAYVGQGQQTPRGLASVDATWVPVPGQQLPAALPATPQLGGASDGIGLYAATVTFDRTGSWKLTARVDIAGKTRSGSTTFSVADKAIEISVGDKAPATKNRLPGSQPATAVDSRANAGSVPDPELHRRTVADAIASGRPTMVVISTPVYCISRFCGPITDTVAALARTNGKAMNFIHLEVWNDFQKHRVNKAAADWIYRPGSTDLQEPWVYVIDRHGRVVQRFDNLASERDLADATHNAISAP